MGRTTEEMGSLFLNSKGMLDSKTTVCRKSVGSTISRRRLHSESESEPALGSASQLPSQLQSASQTQLEPADLVREVEEANAFTASSERAVYAGGKFLNMDRANQASTAYEIQEEIINDYSTITLSDKSLRSSLVAFTSVRDTVVARFTTIKIYLGTDAKSDYIKVNTMWSKCIGNQYVYHVGPYGKTKSTTSVLHILNDVLQSDDKSEQLEKQKKLFIILTDCLKRGQAISKEDLLTINPKFGILSEDNFSLIRARLLALTYLMYHLEITRRPHYEKSAGYKRKVTATGKTILCCEIILDGWTKVLELLKNGFLNIEDVFAADAPYGLPTGKKLLNDDDARLKEKCKRIEDLYLKTFYPERYKAALLKGKRIVPSMEEIHRRLVNNTTFANESPGKPYITPEKFTRVRSLEELGDTKKALDFSNTETVDVEATINNGSFSSSISSMVSDSSKNTVNVREQQHLSSEINCYDQSSPGLFFSTSMVTASSQEQSALKIADKPSSAGLSEDPSLLDLEQVDMMESLYLPPTKKQKCIKQGTNPTSPVGNYPLSARRKSIIQE